MNTDLVHEDDEVRLRAIVGGLKVKGYTKMTRPELEEALANHCAMRMREDLLGRIEEALNQPPRPGEQSTHEEQL